LTVRSHGFIRKDLGHLLALILVPLALHVLPCVAQSDSASDAERIQGQVLNSVTREPIPGALVFSPDNHFAMRTDSEGRFQFTLPKAESASASGAEAAVPMVAAGVSTSYSVSAGVVTENGPTGQVSRPTMLSARKAGFLDTTNLSAVDLTQQPKQITLLLAPEAIIAGHISLPSTEAPDKIELQLFRRLVQNGAPQWVLGGTTTSKSNGDFRFAELQSGTYKLLSRELLDRDPLNTNAHAQQYGYPPVYYPDADNFASAAEIHLAPGETAEPRITLVKQPYFNVKIAVANATPSAFGMIVNVSGQRGHVGPGYALRYNKSTQTIEGLLPNGTYSVEVRSYDQAVAGVMTLLVKGAPVIGARLVLQPSASISINVREEFAKEPPEGSSTVQRGQRAFQVRGPRRYLNVFLVSADDFNTGKSGILRDPSGPDDTALEIQNVLPGRYWVRLYTLYGYVASVRSGSTDLLREPLVVGAGGATIPVEITLRDNSGRIDGQIEQLAASPVPVLRGIPPAFVYCVPTPGSTGQFAEIGVSPNGTFTSQPLAPGEYRVLAFDQQQGGLEYRNPEVMKLYDSKGPVVEVEGGQTEHVTLQLNSARE
jgi:hypothetical protein